jgi:hypothetical protein
MDNELHIKIEYLNNYEEKLTDEEITKLCNQIEEAPQIVNEIVEQFGDFAQKISFNSKYYKLHKDIKLRLTITF